MSLLLSYLQLKTKYSQNSPLKYSSIEWDIIINLVSKGLLGFESSPHIWLYSMNHKYFKMCWESVLDTDMFRYVGDTCQDMWNKVSEFFLLCEMKYLNSFLFFYFWIRVPLPDTWGMSMTFFGWILIFWTHNLFLNLKLWNSIQ